MYAQDFCSTGSHHRFGLNYFLVRKQLIINPQSIETVLKKITAIQLLSQSNAIFFFFKEIVEFLFYEKETH